MRPVLRVLVLLLAGSGLAAQNGSLPVPPNVKAEGLPPIPATLVEKLRPYTQFSRTSLLAWHPTRSEILVSATSGNQPQVHVVTAPGAAPKPIADGVAGGAWFGPLGGDWFIYARDAAGRETTQIYRFDFATGTSTLLTDGKSRNGAPAFARRTNRIAFESSRRNGKDWDLYVMDVLEASSTRMVAEMTGQWSVADWSPDEKELLIVQWLPGNDTALWKLNLETGARAAFTDDAVPSIWRFAQYSPDGKTIYAVSNRSSDLLRVWKQTNGKWTPLTREGDSVEAAALSPDGKTLGVVFDRDASSRLELLDARTLKVRVAPALPAGQISGLRWNPAGTALGFSFNTLRTFSDAFSVDGASGKVTRWTESASGGVDAATMPDPEIVRWKSFDGTMISGVLYRPPAKFTGPRPVMINIHGGPNDAYERPRFQGRSGYFLNEMGVAIIYPNVRGSFGFGRTFEKLDDHRKREDAVRDIGALLDWIAAQKAFDSKRVMVTGASYGGYMTYAAALKYPERIRCAFAGSAIANFVTYLETTEPARVDDRRGEYGDERDPAMREFLLSISPLTHAAKLKVPLMIAHGGNDPRVPLTQAQTMYQAAKANGVPVWFVVFENEGHQTGATRATNDFQFYAWITFVEQFLVN